MSKEVLIKFCLFEAQFLILSFGPSTIDKVLQISYPHIFVQTPVLPPKIKAQLLRQFL